MQIFLTEKTDQELADLIRQNLEKPQGARYFGKLKEKARLSLRYNHACKIRGTDVITLLANNPPV